MRRTVFLWLLTVSLITILLVVPVSLLLYYNTYEDRIEEDLLAELGYAEAIYTGDLPSSSLEAGGRRVTVISPDGTVLYDSEASSDSMDNHIEREEVREALERGIGISERRSATLSEKSVYAAKRLPDGSVLRLSAEAKTPFSFLSLIILPILLVIAVALAVVLFLSRFVAKRIVAPINAIDLDEPEDNETYDELSPLLLRLKKEKEAVKAQIRKSEEKRKEFELVSSSLEEGLAIVSSSGELLSSNSSFRSLLGKDGREDTSIFSYFQDGEGKGAVLSALSGERKEVVLSLSNRMVEVVAYPSEKGGIIILLRDVTEKAEREKMRREFTANVSHELKTPLTTISGFAELLMSGSIPQDKVGDFSGEIYREAGRLISLVEDILNLSSLDEGSDERNEQIDLSVVVGTVLKELSFKAENHNVEMISELTPALVRGSEKLSHEIVFNLVDNAIRYNQSREPWVKVKAEKLSKEVILSVEDNGIGIAKEHQERIFERFYRVDKARSRESGGTGLGLSIVKNAVANMNGRIKLTSAPGKGTKIEIIFPLAD